MFYLSTFISAMADVIGTVIWLYTVVIIVSALLSWVNPDPYNPIVRTLRILTEPVLWRARRLLPFLYINGLDLSPIAVLIALQFLNKVVVSSLHYLAVQMLM